MRVESEDDVLTAVIKNSVDFSFPKEWIKKGTVDCAPNSKKRGFDCILDSSEVGNSMLIYCDSDQRCVMYDVYMPWIPSWPEWKNNPSARAEIGYRGTASPKRKSVIASALNAPGVEAAYYGVRDLGEDDLNRESFRGGSVLEAAFVSKTALVRMSIQEFEGPLENWTSGRHVPNNKPTYAEWRYDDVHKKVMESVTFSHGRTSKKKTPISRGRK